jgi:hypothetical protein
VFLLLHNAQDLKLVIALPTQTAAPMHAKISFIKNSGKHANPHPFASQKRKLTRKDAPNLVKGLSSITGFKNSVTLKRSLDVSAIAYQRNAKLVKHA